MDTTLYEKLLNAAFRFVSFRPRSKKEIHEFLGKKLRAWDTVGDYSLQKAMARLEEYGHVDDKKFADWWVQQRSQFRPKGKRLLMQELAQKGVAREIIGEVFSGAAAENELESEESLAGKAISKKIEKIRRYPLTVQKRKVYTFLNQRGFSSDVIGKIIDGLGKNDYNS